MPDTHLGNQPDVAATVAELVDFVIADDPERKVKREELLRIAKLWDERAPEIDTPERAEKAADLIVELRDAQEAEEAARVAAKAPFLKATKDIDAAYYPRRDTLIFAKGGMERRQKRYLDRLKAETKSETPPVVRSQAGARVSTRKHRVLVVDDLSLVPREYLVLDETKARAALIAGTAIPGLRLADEDRISTRR